MSFFLGMVAGGAVVLVVFVAYMGPKHWEWHQENLDLRKQLKVAVERAAHYQNLVKPSEWGPVEAHEARIVKVPKVYPVDVDPDPNVHFRFDDILDGDK